MKDGKILQILRDIGSKGSPCLLKNNRLDSSGRQLQLWTRVAKSITTCLDDAGLNYTLIKAFNVPWASMDDVDLLIENQADVIQVARILENDGYDVKSIRLTDPLKITATKSDKPIIIDIYPSPKWYDFTYAPQGFISSSKIRGRVHGIETYLPTPELNIYLVATHGYCAGRITLSEILHITTIIITEKPDLSSLRSLGVRFQTSHALYTYLRLVSYVLKREFKFHHASLERLLIDLQGDIIIKLCDRWLNSISPITYDKFPLIIPLRIMAISGLIKLVNRGLDSSIRPYDELLISLRYFYPTGFLFGRFGKILGKPFHK